MLCVFVYHGVDLEKCARVKNLTMAKRSILKQLEEKYVINPKANLCAH